MKKLRVMGVCSGNGVMLHPFLKNPYFEVIGNFEPRAIFHTPQEEQWKLNFGEIPLWRTALRMAGGMLTHDFPDLIIGHPDCGSGSKLRYSRAKELGDYAVNDSLAYFFASVHMFKPKVWVMENLSAFLKQQPKAFLREKFPEYRLIFLEGSVSDWGNSQKSRVRLVIIGIRRDVKGIRKYLEIPYSVAKVQSSEYFEENPEEDLKLGHVYEPWDKTANLIHEDQKKITYKLAKKLWNTKLKGKSKWFVGGKMVNQPGVNRNLPGKLPLTVRKQNRQFRTDGQVLSPREMANIQGIPRKFKLYIDPNKKLYWINKARATVTKTAPYEIALWVSNILMDKRRKLLKNI